MIPIPGRFKSLVQGMSHILRATSLVLTVISCGASIYTKGQTPLIRALRFMRFNSGFLIAYLVIGLAVVIMLDR